MSSAPLPSKLTLLSSLPTHDFGDKVRFLGCVTSYSTSSGQLTLHHKFPKSSDIKAVVDVRLLLEKLTAEQTSTGEWVNVIGYVACAPSQPFAKQSRKRKMESSTVHVQALMLWSSGPLNISHYEACLADVAHSDGPTASRKNPNAT